METATNIYEEDEPLHASGGIPGVVEEVLQRPEKCTFGLEQASGGIPAVIQDVLHEPDETTSRSAHTLEESYRDVHDRPVVPKLLLQAKELFDCIEEHLKQIPHIIRFSLHFSESRGYGVLILVNPRCRETVFADVEKVLIKEQLSDLDGFIFYEEFAKKHQPDATGGHEGLGPGFRVHAEGPKGVTKQTFGYVLKDMVLGDFSMLTTAHDVKKGDRLYQYRDGAKYEIGICDFSKQGLVNNVDLDSSLTSITVEVLSEMSVELPRPGRPEGTKVIHLFQEENHLLLTEAYRRVCKFGAKTGYTEGLVTDACVWTFKPIKGKRGLKTKKWCNTGILVDIESAAGDSGSLITSVKEPTVAIAMLYGAGYDKAIRCAPMTDIIACINRETDKQYELLLYEQCASDVTPYTWEGSSPSNRVSLSTAMEQNLAEHPEFNQQRVEHYLEERPRLADLTVGRIQRIGADYQHNTDETNHVQDTDELETHIKQTTGMP
eukprot:GHVU01108646.1.p1 GENE.GHVU01108646.1~~GHVU01108646.1.p1  ORF type:complete len:491 (+),score=49.22 GHVU01108646.1:129-1601(+)